MNATREQKILIIIPAYNEAESVSGVIQSLQNLDLSVHILVVDDGSPDATASRARESGGKVMSLPYNLGIGGAVQTGFQFALKQGYDIAIQVDGDGQHDVGFIPDLIAPVSRNEADMTIGSRFIPPYTGYRSSAVRRLGIHFFAWLISGLTGFSVTDPTSGLRAYNRKMIQLFSRYYPHDYPEPEAILVAGRHGARLKEVPVQMKKRAHGKSSIRYLWTLYYMVKVTFAILLDKAKHRGDL